MDNKVSIESLLKIMIEALDLKPLGTQVTWFKDRDEVEITHAITFYAKNRISGKLHLASTNSRAFVEYLNEFENDLLTEFKTNVDEFSSRLEAAISSSPEIPPS